jgi:DNA-binding beta-propeller fold protein YncE
MSRTGTSGTRRRIAALGVACLASGLTGACTMGSAGGTAPATGQAVTAGTTRPTATPRVRPTPTPVPAAILGSFDAGGAGWSLAVAGGALWIQVDLPVNAIVRIDTATGTAAPAVPRGHKVKAGGEGLWVVGRDWLVRVDPASAEETLRVPMGGAFALDEGAAWLFNERGLHRIDATTGAVGRPIGPDLATVCADPKDLLMAFDSAWLACKEGKVVRLDISSGVVTPITTEAGAHTLVKTDAAVWVTNYEAGSVSRIDPAGNKVSTIAGVGSGVGITVGDGFVWAAARTGIAKIDPLTASIVGTIALGPGEYYDLAWDDGLIWASTRGNRVLKVDPAMAGP